MEVTLLTEDTRVHYTGDGVTKEFNYSFNPIDLSYVKVYKNLQQITTPDVTVASGVVTFNVAPAEGDSVVIMREKPLTYDSGIASKGIISSDSLDNMAVDLLGQIQQVNEKLDRVPVYPIDTTMTGEEILNQFNQDVQTVKDNRVEVEGKAEEINNAVSSGLTEINNTTSESKSQITEEKNTSISEIQRVTEGLIDRAEVAADESESWANKAEDFANQANLDIIRTNCITKIPQNIKLELNDGMLTLKAGSKVYVPNGVGKFDVITIQSDSSVTANANVPLMLFIDTSTNKLTYEGVNGCFSGNTAPTSAQIMTWYDTQENKVKRSLDKGATWTSYRSLPIGIANCDTTKITSIDQVFNGFGYIGSTIFALPNVEGLIPNGRNTDGSLNNTKLKTTAVSLAPTYPTSSNSNKQYLFIYNENAITDNGGFYESYVEPDNWANQVWFDTRNNLIKYKDGGGNVVTVQATMFGTCSVENGRITSFNPKTAFHAADYQDVPKLAGNNTFSGINFFNGGFGNNVEIYLDNPHIDRDVNPSEIRYCSYLMRDKNGKQLANFYCFQNTDGSITTNMIATGRDGKDSGIAVARHTNGQTVTYVPTPPAGDNSTQIANTAWVRSSVGVQSGTIIAFAGSSTPTGYLPCNGAAVSRTTYSALFSSIGITWGAGDGSTTFNLPNLTDRFLEGGGVVGQLIGAGLPNIVGQVNIPNGIYQAGATYFATSGSLIFRSGATQRGNAGQQGAGGRIEINASASSAIYGASATVQPNAARVLFCIKY